MNYEADPRQGEQFIRELGLEGAKPVVAPGLKATHEQVTNDSLIAEDKQRSFRATSARC